MNTICQYCIDRQIPEPNEADYLYKNLPICDACLEPIMQHTEDLSTEQLEQLKQLDFKERKIRAIELLDKLEEIYDNWPLTADETLQSHSDFYNHKPPALVNMTLDQILEVFNRRKGILFAVRHKDERWSNEIDILKKTAREEANLTGIKAGRKEITKKIKPGQESLKAKEKLAAALGISLSQLELMGRSVNEEKFNTLVGQKKDSVPILYPPVIAKESTGQILKDLQNQVKLGKPKRTINPVTGKPYKED